MTPDVSVAEVLANLEERIAFHRQQADFHAQQEVHHRDQNAVHLAELKRVTEHFEAFKAVALSAVEVAQERRTAPPQPIEEPEDDSEFIGKRIMPSRLVARVVDRMPDDATFGARQVTAEVNRRYKDKLRKPVQARAVSITLRRLQANGRLLLVRQGCTPRSSRRRASRRVPESRRSEAPPAGARSRSRNGTPNTRDLQRAAMKAPKGPRHVAPGASPGKARVPIPGALKGRRQSPPSMPRILHRLPSREAPRGVAGAKIEYLVVALLQIYRLRALGDCHPADIPAVIRMKRYAQARGEVLA